jgi:hypothetical protein
MKTKNTDYDPFLEGSNLDTRGLPLDLNNLPPEESFIDEEFGGLVSERRYDMRRELAALADDPEVLRQLAKTDPAAAEELEERRNEEAAMEFTKQHPGYYVCDENANQLDAYLKSKHLPMTSETLGRAYDHLQAAGRLRVSPDVPRVIPESQKIRLARMAANGDAQNAFITYLQLRLPQAIANAVTYAANQLRVDELLNDPAQQEIVREAITEVWFWSHPNVPPAPELRGWFKNYTEHMPTFNFQTLDAAWLGWYDWKESHNQIEKRNALLGLRGEPKTEPTQAEIVARLDDLSDAEINRLMRGVARERAGRSA